MSRLRVFGASRHASTAVVRMPIHNSTSERIGASQMTAFTKALQAHTGQVFADYKAPSGRQGAALALTALASLAPYDSNPGPNPVPSQAGVRAPTMLPVAAARRTHAWTACGAIPS